MTIPANRRQQQQNGADRTRIGCGAGPFRRTAAGDARPVFARRRQRRHRNGRCSCACMAGDRTRLTLADMMRYIAPYNDYASLRAPLTLQAAGTLCTPGAYSWFHDCVPIPAKTSTATRSPHPWLSTIGCRQNIPEDRAVVPIGFSQGGLLAIHSAAHAPGTLRVRRFRCPDFLRPALVCGNRAGGRSRRLNSTFRRSSAMARTIR